MSSLIAKIARESVAITGLATSVIGLLVAFGVDLTEVQIGAIVAALGALMLVLSRFTTPTSEVAVQVKGGAVIAGPAAVEPTGINVVDDDLGDNGDIASVKIKPELLT